MSVPAQKMKSIPFLAMVDGTLRLSCSFMEKEVAKSVPGYRWNNKEKAWEYPVSTDVFQKMQWAFPILQIEPGVRETLDAIMEQEQAVQAAKAAGWENVEPIEPMPVWTEPFDHQVLGYNIGLQIPAAALLMEQGCGKSLTAVAIAGQRYRRGEVKKVLITAPASVVPVWPKEFELHSTVPHKVFLLEGSVMKRIALLESLAEQSELQVAVTNYEAAWRMEEALLAWKPDMIVCDESQRIKTPGARQSKALHKLGRVAKYRLILTGTPVTQNPLDFFSQYKFLEPSIFGNSFYAFRARYAIMGGFEGRQVMGFRNLDELVQKAHKVAFRCTKVECLDLPEWTDQTVYCGLETDAARVYRQLQTESVAELSGGTLTAANVLSKLLRLSQLSGGFLGDGEGDVHQLSNAKINLLGETLDDLLGAGKKVVVFARFLPEIESIRKLLSLKKVPYEFIIGAVPLAERGAAVERFQTDENIKVFLAQIQCAGLGITLTAADTAIFYSLDFSFANYDQCRARIHRIGQKSSCTYVHLVTKDTVDEKILAALKSKRDVATEVVDNWRNYFEKECQDHGDKGNYRSIPQGF